MPSFAKILQRDLERILELSDELLKESGINYDPRKVERLSRGMGVAFLAIIPDSSWTALGDRGRRLQREVLESWRNWLERFRLMFLGDAASSRSALEDAAAKVTKWLDRSEGDFSIPPRLEDAPAAFRKHVAPFFELLRPFTDDGPMVVVPDTNILLANQELPSWSTSLGSEQFTVLLVPGVLSEMDEHKVNHRVPEVREKATAFARRLRGWRNQGSLAAGVKVQGEIRVRVVAREPNFEHTLSWLDKDVVDDRILASVLDWQRCYPDHDVHILSRDSIMLAKADEAGVPTSDVAGAD